MRRAAGFPQVVRGHEFHCDNQQRIGSDQRYGFEIICHVVREGQNCAVEDMRGPVAENAFVGRIARSAIGACVLYGGALRELANRPCISVTLI